MTEKIDINTLLAYRAVADGKFARILDRAINDDLGGKGISPELLKSVLHHASKNVFAFEFADRMAIQARG